MSTHPDPERLGGYAWTTRTRGRLTRRERLTLLGAIATSQRDYLMHRLRRDRPRTTPHPHDRPIVAPDSAFAREIEEAAAEQNPVILAHSYRSWIFGRALADVDGTDVDDELLYAGALLHDHGLVPAVPGEDFTLRSARRATEAATAVGLAPERTASLADAITVHTTPGVTIARDGALGYYIQNGAMVDIVGQRLWDLPADLVADTLARYDRAGFTRGLGGHFTDEARAVRGGRFALVRRCGFVPLIRLAPFERTAK